MLQFARALLPASPPAACRVSKLARSAPPGFAARHPTSATSGPSHQRASAVEGPASVRRVLVFALPSLALLLASRVHLRGAALAAPPPHLHQQPQQSPHRHPASGVFLAAMHTQGGLVEHLRREGVVKHREVDAALRACDRQHYVDRGIPSAYVYQDAPLPIGYHETISAPHMHATCLELLREQLVPGARVLDVGSGSGYLAAAMGLMVSPGGRVLGIEKHPELAELSLANVRADHPELLDGGVVQLRAGNVLGSALAAEEPFDAIHVGAAASTLPDVLVAKLRPGGRMVIPVGPQWDYQVMEVVDKDAGGRVHKRDLMHVRYVPLTSPEDRSWEE